MESVSVTKRKYATNGIREALFQVQFEKPEAWNATAFGAMFNVVQKDGYSESEETKTIIFQIAPHPEIQEDSSIQIMRFKKPDGTGMVQLGPNLFAVNQISSYPGWESFKPVILKGFEDLLQVAKPQKFQSIALRYINRFDFPFEKPDNSVALGKYVTNVPEAIPGLGFKATNFAIHQSFEDNEGGRLSVVAGYPPDEIEDHVSVILDLTHSVSVGPGYDKDSLEIQLEKSHDIIYKAFELCITDDLRALLKEVH